MTKLKVCFAPIDWLFALNFKVWVLERKSPEEVCNGSRLEYVLNQRISSTHGPFDSMRDLLEKNGVKSEILFTYPREKSTIRLSTERGRPWKRWGTVQYDS